jgi:hypothetical protein
MIGMVKMPEQLYIRDTRLTPRWTKLGFHKQQSLSYRSIARFNINHSGRRSGKTELVGKRRIIKKALKGGPFPDWRCFVGAPVRHQAKKIYWSDLKAMIPKQFIWKINESELIIHLVNASEIHVVGLDRPERVEGIPWDHGLLDEYGNMKPNAWDENIRPALSDRKGSCDFIGVPEGRNHYFDLTLLAKEEIAAGGEDWAIWHWPSWEILDEDEIRAAKRDMDELVFMQEYGGQFINFTGMAYYQFDADIHVGRYFQYYNPKKPIVLCFDFNVSPGVAVIAQEMGSDVFDIPMGKTITVAIGEVYIPRQSNTVRVCEKIIADWHHHQGNIICYGDSTGGAEGSAKVKGSDWDLIKSTLMPHFGKQLYFNVPLKNPRERQRVNAVNSRLMAYDGEVKMVVDGHKCPHLVKDLEGVRVIEGTAGQIDKKSDPKLTHISDALGYYVVKQFPVARYYTREDILAMLEKRNREKIDRAMNRRDSMQQRQAA